MGQQVVSKRQAKYSWLLAFLLHAFLCAYTEGRLPQTQAPFGAVLYLNLDRRPDRDASILRELSASKLAHTLGVQRIAAYDGRAAPLHQLVMDGQLSPAAYASTMSGKLIRGEFMTLGALGCLMSHFRVWQKVVELNVTAIVLEDDVNIHASFDRLLPLIAQELPSDWGLLYLANLVNTEAVKNAQYDYSTLLWKLSDQYWGTYAYAITPSAARRLLAETFPIRWQADSFIMNVTKAFDIPVFRSKVNLVTTDNADARDTDVQVVDPVPGVPDHNVDPTCPAPRYHQLASERCCNESYSQKACTCCKCISNSSQS